MNWGIAKAAGGASQNHLGGLEAWQWMLMAGIVPAVAYLVCASLIPESLIPESPRYLVAAGKVQQARSVLRSVEEPSVDVDAQVAAIGRSLAGGTRSRLRDLISRRFGLLPIVWPGRSA